MYNVRVWRNHHHWSTIEDPLSLETPMAPDSQWRPPDFHPIFSVETPFFHWRPQIFVGDPQFLNPIILGETRIWGSPMKIWGTEIKIWVSPIKIWGSPMKIWGTEIKIWVSPIKIWGVSNENMGISNETSTGVSNEKGSPKVLQKWWFLPRLYIYIIYVTEIYKLADVGTTSILKNPSYFFTTPCLRSDFNEKSILPFLFYTWSLHTTNTLRNMLINVYRGNMEWGGMGISILYRGGDNQDCTAASGQDYAKKYKFNYLKQFLWFFKFSLFSLFPLFPLFLSFSPFLPSPC